MKVDFELILQTIEGLEESMDPEIVDEFFVTWDDIEQSKKMLKELIKEQKINQ